MRVGVGVGVVYVYTVHDLSETRINIPLIPKFRTDTIMVETLDPVLGKGKVRR